MRLFSLVMVVLFLAGCAGTPRTTADMTAVVAMSALESQAVSPGDYRIGEQDLLNVRVFQVEDLSFPEMRVDSSGTIDLPLIGSVQAVGRTPSELAEDIRTRLASRYLQDPQVTVRVVEAASQKVTVDGAVTEPGVYQMKGRTTLLQAVAMAKGATRISNKRSVAVFRTLNGQRMVALFDLAAIQNGQAADPVLQGDDIVVVDTSRLNSAIQDALAVLPSVAAFVAYN